ncbi:Na+/H+ antiporter subunit E [Streptomyces abyssomicinicus]|uniref:Na+/H+ antiporter subunit E n=1 Tax=Streptomyces abyssomicinicus TaxID=574929 RepID=UPI001250B30C|nr:Na+/H+ antiporter subunit E [Streptomyces abyssomicinicus]
MNRSLLRRLPSLLWLWLLWILLWSTPSPLVVLGGLLVAVAVLAVSRFPEVSRQITVRPLRLLALCVRMTGNLVVSAAAVGWAALRHGPRVRAAIVELPLDADTDLLVTLATLVTNVSPGSLVLEIDRHRGVLYVHVLLVAASGEPEEARRKLLATERRLVAALGRRPDPSTSPTSRKDDA